MFMVSSVVSGDNLLPGFFDQSITKEGGICGRLLKFILFSDTKLLDERSVSFKICLLKIIEQATSLTDHLVHTTS